MHSREVRKTREKTYQICCKKSEPSFWSETKGTQAAKNNGKCRLENSL